jgi:hypothetical protein
MVPGEVAQIKIGDYVIPKKGNKCVLVCTNVVVQQLPPEYFTDHMFCFEILGELDDYGSPNVVLLDMREILKFKGTLIKKNTKAAKNLEMLYAKV